MLIAVMCCVVICVHVILPAEPWLSNTIRARSRLDCPCLTGYSTSRVSNQSAQYNRRNQPTIVKVTSIPSSGPNRHPVVVSNQSAQYNHRNQPMIVKIISTPSSVPDRQPVVVSDPSKSVICHRFSPGRLGNHLFEYASILGIARTTNKTVYFLNEGVLLGILKYPPVQTRHEEMRARCKKAKVLSEKYLCSFDRQLIALEEGQDYDIREYLQSWLYFDGMREEMKTLVTFKDDIVQEAAQVMGDLRRQYANTTLVGVHVRRGDLQRRGAVGGGYLVAPVAFFHRAMTYFRQRFHSKVTFLVLSEPEDHQWCVQNVKAGSADVVVLHPRSAAVDMQILSLTDHFIRTVGTFGWWAAFKNLGTPTVVFLEEFSKKGSAVSKFYSPTAADYMLPRWLPM